MTRQPRIQGKKNFSLVFRKGLRVRIQYMTLHFHAVSEGPVRTGVVVSAAGGAVERNRTKRRLRDLLRNHAALLPAVPGLLILQYKRSLEPPFGALHNDFVSGLGKLRTCLAL